MLQTWWCKKWKKMKVVNKCESDLQMQKSESGLQMQESESDTGCNLCAIREQGCVAGYLYKFHSSKKKLNPIIF